MKRRHALLIGLLGLIVIGLGGVWLSRNLEYYQKEEDQGPSPKARANPYMAAELFLRKRNVPVTVTDNLDSLPDTGPQTQTLLLLDSRENMKPSQVERLLNWTRAGGRLLFVAEQLWDAKKGRSGDLLLDRVQVRQFRTVDLLIQEAEKKPSVPLTAPLVKAPEKPYGDLTKLYLENEDSPAYMSFDPNFHLDDPEDHAQSWANSADATHMLQMIYGRGMITVVTDADLWKTRNIGKYDNAWLLWYLTQDSSVTMLLRPQHDNLLSLLLRYFPQALTALALLAGLALWHVGLRHGPLQAPAPRARRQLTEHLRASADFVLRRSGQQALLRSLQQDVLRRARQRHPGFELLGVADQWQVLARLTRQPTSAVGQALRPRPNTRMSRTDFTRQVAHLQTLRNAL